MLRKALGCFKYNFGLMSCKYISAHIFQISLSSLTISTSKKYTILGIALNNKKNIHYNGAFPPNELPYVLSGSFGLV